MDKHIAEITKRLELAKDVVNDLTKARDALRKVCIHEDVYTGHGHNESYYACTKCGREYSE